MDLIRCEIYALLPAWNVNILEIANIETQILYNHIPCKLVPLYITFYRLMASKQLRKLTDEEVEDYKKAFSYFDIDGNGSITVSELRQVLVTLGESPTDQEIIDMISDVDEDRNGTIEFNEFLVMMARQMREVIYIFHR